MKCCPVCNSISGVEWNDYGYTYTYNQTFGGSIETRDCIHRENKTKLPVYCRCINCGARLKIKDVEESKE